MSVGVTIGAFLKFLELVSSDKVDSVRLILEYNSKLANMKLSTVCELNPGEEHDRRPDVTPLILAKSMEMISLLLEKGADPDVVIDDIPSYGEKISALSHALQLFEKGDPLKVDYDKVKILSGVCKRVEFSIPNCTLLDLAIKYYSKPVMEFLLGLGHRILLNSPFYKSESREQRMRVTVSALIVAYDLDLPFDIEDEAFGDDLIFVRYFESDKFLETFKLHEKELNRDDFYKIIDYASSMYEYYTSLYGESNIKNTIRENLKNKQLIDDYSGHKHDEEKETTKHKQEKEEECETKDNTQPKSNSFLEEFSQLFVRHMKEMLKNELSTNKNNKFMKIIPVILDTLNRTFEGII